MPPKGSGKKYPDDFWYKADKILCRVCFPDGQAGAEHWILEGNRLGHLKSRSHKKALGEQGEQRALAEQLAAERRAATDAPAVPLNPVQIHHSVSADPLAESSKAATEMVQFSFSLDEASAADFGFEEETQSDGHAVLREKLDGFGTWDVGETARRLGFEDAESIPRAGDEEDDEILADILRIADILDHDTTGIKSATGDTSLPTRDGDWAPYPFKLWFLLDFIDNLPRLRLSSALLRMVIFVLKQYRCQDPVPSYDTFRKFQKELRGQCGVATIPCRSPLGNVFFMNDVKQLIANDYANLTTRKLLRFYPEITEDGAVREWFHASKLRREMELDWLSPMYDAGRCVHFYVNEVARLKTGAYIIPIRWVIFRGKVHADFLDVEIDVEGNATVKSEPNRGLVAAKDLADDFLTLQDKGLLPHWTAATVEAGYPAQMPNPKHDVSGNRSKSWNKHFNAYLTHRNLPRQLLQQEFHVHFISTSQNASVAEQYREFKATVESTHAEPIEVQNPEEVICVSIYVNAGPSDNPMASEISAHIGGKGNHPCRKCKIGGTQEEKASSDGFEAFFATGSPRTKDGVRAELQHQIQLACAGVATPIKETQTNTGVKDPYTQYWIDDILSRYKMLSKSDPQRDGADIECELLTWVNEHQAIIENPFYSTTSFDPTKDTPVEILHTMLLGITKYIWHVTHSKFSAELKKTYVPRLQATNTNGLSIPAIRAGYILKYAGSLVGRQLKILVQTSPFHVGDLVDDQNKFVAWRASGELAALLWMPEIKNMEQHCADLRVAVANVLDVFAALDPSKIIAKMKYHLLCHLDVDVERMGPLVGFATENYESFNAVFRHCSILSNHLSPSRDIGQQLAKQERFKHIITGGAWVLNGELFRASPSVRAFLSQHTVLQKLIGWSPTGDIAAGSVTLASKKGAKIRETFELASTLAARTTQLEDYGPRSMWMNGARVVSQALHDCDVGAHVFAQPVARKDGTVPPIAGGKATPSRRPYPPPICGSIAQIIAADNTALVIIKELRLLPARDEWYGMPVLVPTEAPGEDSRYIIVPANNILFDFNVQHDCRSAKCAATGQRAVIQERVASGRTEAILVHQPLERYIINLSSFHNAHLVREILPRDLWAPVPLYLDRKQHHDNLADRIRVKRASKRKRAEEDNEGRELGSDSEDRPPPTKKAKASKPRKRAPPVARRPLAHQASFVTPDTTSLVRNRTARKITKTAKQLALEEAEETDADDGDSETEPETDASGREFDEDDYNGDSEG
ncbi:hypothetical protein GGX14DRAFT_560838 [Mycena pura]|uniref:Uncharacterized protein n=1 Tax=Mycena pura TaxID=153505 RepID=A0AAD6VPS0_9AGAR|nr:hypothetical protein GGX14DRAFT_560838 [Mycena pura]